MNVEARDSRLIPEAPQSPKQGWPRFSRLVSAVETGIDAPGAFGRHMDQNQRTPRSAFYEPKFHRGPKHRRATGPGSYSELDLKVGELLDAGYVSARHYAEGQLHEGGYVLETAK